MRRFLKAATSLALAATLALGLVAVGGVGKTSTKAATPKFLGQVVAEKGDIADLAGYKPTQIINGKFDVHPFMYIPKSGGGFYTMEEILNEVVKQTDWTPAQKAAWEAAAFSWESGATDDEKTAKMDAKNPSLRLEKGTSGNTYGKAYIVGPNESYTIDITDVLNGLGRTHSWRTTESKYQYESVRIKDYFEWINTYPSNANTPSGLGVSYGNINFATDDDPNKVDPCVELNKAEEATLYQDLGTTGRDIIMWELSHAGRSSGTNNMQVVIGPYDSDAEAGGEYTNVNIRSGYGTIFTNSGVNQGAFSSFGNSLAKQAGYAETGDLTALNLSQNTNWATVKGIYIVPENQKDTRFAFQSTKGGGSMGNFLDDVVFDTLAGNLKTTVNDDGSIVITGYWGDLDGAGDELVYEIFGNDTTDPVATVLLNMGNVPPGPFKATISTPPAGYDTPEKIQELKDNQERNDVIPKDYYDEVVKTNPSTLPLTVKFDTLTGGKLKNPSSQSKNSGEYASDPKDLTPADPNALIKDKVYLINGKYKKFKGWDENKTGGAEFDFSRTPITADKTLYAQWENAAGLVFNGNPPFGAGPVSNVPSGQASDGTLDWTGTNPTDLSDASTIPALPGYKFAGWYDNPGGTGSPYTFTAPITSGTKTLYAKWEKQYVVDFNLNSGGEATGQPDNQYFDPTPAGHASNPANPSRTGYTFAGWAETPDGDPVDITLAEVTGDKTYYAKWKQNTGVPTGGFYAPPAPEHKVEFVTPVGPKPDTQAGIKDGGTAKDPATFKPGDEVDGKTFEGWFKDPEFKVPYDFNEKVNEDITIYAKWKNTDGTVVDKPEPSEPKKEVKIEFESEIGLTPVTQVTEPGNSAIDPGAPADPDTLKPGMIINGYRFDGWFLDKELTIPYVFGTSVNEDIILYAKWTNLGAATSPKTGDRMVFYWLAMAVAGLLTLLGRKALLSNKRK